MNIWQQTHAKATRRIFVFGSNYAGRHGRGSAREAVLQHGAVYGCGEGLQGNSYAIPTKDYNLRVLPIETIKSRVERFLMFAAVTPECHFDVVEIGCGLAGYEPEQIAPLFERATINVHLSERFNRILGR
jgi:hypothetical protein